MVQVRWHFTSPAHQSAVVSAGLTEAQLVVGQRLGELLESSEDEGALDLAHGILQDGLRGELTCQLEAVGDFHRPAYRLRTDTRLIRQHTSEEITKSIPSQIMTSVAGKLDRLIIAFIIGKS